MRFPLPERHLLRYAGRACVLAAALCVLCAAPAEAAPGRRVVAILPMGKVPAARVAQVAAAVEAAYPVRARVEPARELPQAAWNPVRRRWRAERILEAVEASPPAGAWKVLVLTEAELSTTKGKVEDWGIGGLGLIGGRSSVVSTHILRQHSKTAAKLEERVRKLAVHELGHTLGLEHCQVFGCVMRDAQGKLIRSLDASTEGYCGRCRNRVRDGAGR